MKNQLHLFIRKDLEKKGINALRRYGFLLKKKHNKDKRKKALKRLRELAGKLTEQI